MFLKHKLEKCSLSGLKSRRSPAAGQVARVQQVAVGKQDRVGLLGCLNARCVPEPAHIAISSNAAPTRCLAPMVSCARAEPLRKPRTQSAALALLW